MENRKFIDIYQEIKDSGKKIIEIPSETIESIQYSVDKYKARLDVDLYFALVLSCFVVSCLPYMLFRFISISSFYAPKLVELLSCRDFLKANFYPDMTVVYITINILILTFPSLFLKMLPYKRFKRKPFKAPMWRWFFLIFCYYFMIVVLMLYFISYDLLPEKVILIILEIWMELGMLCVLSVVLFILTVLVMMVYYAFKIKFITRNEITKYNIAGVIVFELAGLLVDVSSYDFTSLNNVDLKKTIGQKIVKISNLMGSMGEILEFSDKTDVNRYIKNRFYKASDIFYSLRICVYIANSSAKRYLYQKILSMLNIFLSGNYEDLPQHPIVGFKPPKYNKYSFLRKALFNLVLALLVSLPILSLISYSLCYGPIQGFNIRDLLTILYIVWIIMVVFIFIDKLAPEAKTLSVDFLKSILSRK